MEAGLLFGEVKKYNKAFKWLNNYFFNLFIVLIK